MPCSTCPICFLTSFKRLFDPFKKLFPSALRRYLVFHDFWMPPVEHVITELESEGLISCRSIGLQNWDRHRKAGHSHASKHLKAS